MATRFFFLPWASRLDLGNGGAPRYAPGWWGYDQPGHDVLYTGGGTRTWHKRWVPGAMPAYSVTTDGARVPLTEVGIASPIAYDDPFPHYPPSSIFPGTSCAYVDPGKPQDYTDARNPAVGFYAMRPFANWVYRLAGAGSITMLNFLYRVGDFNDYVGPYTVNTRVRLDYYNTYAHPVNGQPYHQAPISRVGPATIYIYRPGVGVHHVVMTTRATGGYGAGYSFTFGVDKSSFPAIGTIKQIYNQLNAVNWTYNTENVTWQDGDLLVWEMWHEVSGWYVKDDPSLAPAKTISFMVGGGTAGQPLTINGGTGFPNWAPAWYSKGAITGYEPSPARPPQASVGF